MRIGAFELLEPLPVLDRPIAVAYLRPWLDAGDVGSVTIGWLEKQAASHKVGELARPGNFFDFTRYRPNINRNGGKMQVTLPNSEVSRGVLPAGKDVLFFKLLEPHMFAEDYIESVVQLFRKFEVSRFILLGSMYDYVPHTRPLLVSGGATGSTAAYQLEVAGVRNSDYQGPTSITSVISQQAYEMDIESLTLIVHLPQYTELDEDYLGVSRVMQVLNSILGVVTDDAIIQECEKQKAQIAEAVDGNPELKLILEQLEAHYDVRDTPRRQTREQGPRLSPDVENFLKDIEGRFGQDKP